MTLYQQLTHRLRWSNGPGLGDTVSERPRHQKTLEFLDGPDGTVVEIPEDVGVDVAFLLRIGAIQELPAGRAPGKEPAPHGKTARESHPRLD